MRQGVPFREAHRRTGELLKQLSRRRDRCGISSADEWDSFGVAGGVSLLDPDASVRARSGVGGPSPASVVDQSDAIGAWLAAR